MNVSWNSPVEVLFKSKNSSICKKLTEVKINCLKDLLWLIPKRVHEINQLKDRPFAENEYVSVLVKIKNIQINNGKKSKKNFFLKNISILAEEIDRKIHLNIKWFNAWPGLIKQIEDSEYLALLGQISIFNHQLQLINPEINSHLNSKKLIVEYPTVNTVPGKKIEQLFHKIPKSLWENIPTFVSTKINSFPIEKAFKIIHGIELNQSKRQEAFERIIYEEFFLEQINIYARKKNNTSAQNNSIQIEKNLISTFERKIPFKLTTDQKNTLSEIIEDLNNSASMARILQGDVGCGKTLVALGAAWSVSQKNYQSTIMAPTEALAHQIYINALPLFAQEEIKLLTSSTKPSIKEKILHDLSIGKLRLIIGTHSLIQDEVIFKNLGLIIIDEQHKFGVEQRLKLLNKCKIKNTLLMSATPIPRSLSITKYGDLKLSTIRELPSGRKKISSKIITQDNFSQFLNFIKTRIEMSEQIYVVVPAIEENELFEIQNIERVYQFFRKIFSENLISILHGKLVSKEKEEVLNKFKENQIEILISTSVIEVGIDVPNATVMCIFGPERFGLSSLHQLRGRVGRGGKPGFFFMIEDKKLSADAIKRLQIIEQTNDGFKIAEEDLKIRGEGNIIGVEQSGINHRTIANLTEHENIFNKVIEDFAQSEQYLNSLNYQIKDEVIFTI